MSAPSDPWAAFAHDPRDPTVAPLRAADADRDLVRSVLATAYAEGRLDRTEFDERSDQVDRARLLGDLPALIVDLVPHRASPVAPLAASSDQDLVVAAHEAYVSARRQALLAFIGPTIVCWAIWGAIAVGSGTTFPWPLIVMAATLVGYLRVALGREDWIREETARLEKQRAKQLRSRSKGRNRQRMIGEIRDQIPPLRRDGDDGPR